MCSRTSALAPLAARAQGGDDRGVAARAQRVAERHREVALPALVADAADRAALGAAQELGLVPGPELEQRRRGQAPARASKSASGLRCANLFHGQTSWQSSQP